MQIIIHNQMFCAGRCRVEMKVTRVKQLLSRGFDVNVDVLKGPSEYACQDVLVWFAISELCMCALNRARNQKCMLGKSLDIE